MKDEFRRLEETNVWNRVVVFLFTVKKQQKKKEEAQITFKGFIINGINCITVQSGLAFDIYL